MSPSNKDGRFGRTTSGFLNRVLGPAPSAREAAQEGSGPAGPVEPQARARPEPTAERPEPTAAPAGFARPAPSTHTPTPEGADATETESAEAAEAAASPSRSAAPEGPSVPGSAATEPSRQPSTATEPTQPPADEAAPARTEPDAPATQPEPVTASAAVVDAPEPSAGDTGRQAPASAPSDERSGGSGRMVTALCLLVGLVLGLGAAFAVASSSRPKYSATTNYAVLPGTKATSQDIGQAGYLTPVFAAQANDPKTADEVKAQMGGVEPAKTSSSTFPDAQLLFSVTATGSDAKNVYDTLQAFEKVLVRRAEAGRPVDATRARLDVVSHATEPTKPDSLDPKVVYLAGGIAGLLVGLAAALGLARRRQGNRHTPSHGR